jgi:hypothetical protein
MSVRELGRARTVFAARSISDQRQFWDRSSRAKMWCMRKPLPQEGVVTVAQREYESTRETLYLMASPVNRSRLSEAVARLEAGGGAVRELADEDTTL